MKATKRESKPIAKLKGLRAEKMITQEDIAGMMGISTATYNRKENGLGRFDANEIAVLVEVFSVKFEDIFLS
ncbi:MAG: helix-turn-helix domain-containing protein [Clostridiales bacterium]|jgi:DNA-binding XRE family transcriptional regulator|nr:helix-turn-helix domain-containing protein [Clostridiales bacterium]